MRAPLFIGLTFLFLGSALPAQEEGGKLQSGIKVGAVLPGPFDAYNVSGKTARGRQHCLVCDYGLNPVVMIFAREPAEGKDGPLMTLLSKLDETVSRYHDDRALGGCVIFLSPDAYSSANNSNEQDPKKLVDEAIARDALVKRLEERADKLKNVAVAFYPPEGPKDYDINPKAEVTVLFYIRQKILANFAFGEGKMTDDDVAKIIKTVDDSLARKKAR